MTLNDLVGKLSANGLDRTAVVDGPNTISYAALLEHASHTAQRIVRSSVDGAAVVTDGTNAIKMCCAMLAAVMAGRPFVVPTALSTEAIAGLHAQIGDLAIVDSRGQVESCEFSSSSSRVSVPRIGRTNDTWNHAETAYVALSSGSFREPTGTAVPASGLAHFITWAQDELGVDCDTNWLELAPASSDMAIVNSLLTLMSGGTLVIARTQRERLMPGIAFKQSSPTHCRLVPKFADLMLARGHLTRDRLSTMKCFGFGGDVVRTETVRALSIALHDAEIIGTYGMSETTGFNLWWRADSELADTPTMPLGESVPGWEANSAAIAESGEPSELLISGRHVGLGYVGRQPSSREVFVQNPDDSSIRTVFTGDLARRIGSDIYFAGRRDRVVNLNGTTVDLDAVDRALTDEWQTQCASVMTKRGIVAFVEGPPREMYEHFMVAAGRVLTPSSRPNSVVAVASFPQTESGKISWRELERLGEGVSR